MSDLTWMFLAFFAVWVLLGLYLASLGARQRKLENRVDALERTRN